ncbi:MAG: 6-hydroxymethylpterin diphosphokinase MptE-like protein [Planctomycetota bacterium]
MTPTDQLTASASATETLLARNLALLAAIDPHLASQIAQTPPPADFEPIDTPDGVPSATLGGRALASKRRPLDEAKRQTAHISPADHAAFVILGFGLGHHVRAIADACHGKALLIIYEPDLALLRAAFELIDHTEWLATCRVVFAHTPDDRAHLSARLKSAEGLIAMGVKVIEHPPSLPRLGEGAATFSKTVSDTVASLRTQIITAMVQTQTSVRNGIMNLDRYAAGAHDTGITALKDVAAGTPAIVVSAGPSLGRSLELLRDPRVRERCVIICVQTVLKTLLREGIRPHFVTALDYHEISKRFYEGLTPEDVAGVTLVAEPKANPAIIDSFPGRVRFVADPVLDAILPKSLRNDHGSLEQGATVAHLAYYLARHLGSDPVILVGQDLAFTDGQYYAAGAAIHDVWACELNPFNTLETMEWQRIVRFRAHLHKGTDHLGRSIYTDDQMASYLAQFERDFQKDEASGLRIIDATEGGIRKKHTQTMTLRSALETFAPDSAPSTPDFASLDDETHDPAAQRKRLADTRLFLRNLARDLHAISDHSRGAIESLERMKQIHRENPPARDAKINELVKDVNACRQRIEAMPEAWWLVQRVNQTGALKRARADRRIEFETGNGAIERQVRQIERDRINVDWTRDVAESMADLAKAGVHALDTGEKRTRDLLTPDLDDADTPATTRRVTPTIICDERALQDIDGTPAIARTLDRIAHIDTLDEPVLITDRAQDLRRAIGDRHAHIIEHDLGARALQRRAIRVARAFAPTCWRSTLGHLTCYDEAFDPVALDDALRAHASEAEALLILGADWVELDNTLTQAVIARHIENPSVNPIAFCQAPPGLAPLAIDRMLVRALAAAQREHNPFAHVGGLLGYVPVRPQTDPIAKHACVPIEPHIRDAHRTFIPGGERINFIIDVTHNGDTLPFDTLHNVISHTASHGGTLTIGTGAHALDGHLVGHDPLDHPELESLLRSARDAGIDAIHLRTALHTSPDRAHALASLVDIVSVDAHAWNADTYRMLTGTEQQPMRDAVNVLLEARDTTHGYHTPWVCMRIARRDEVYSEIETFYDRWLLAAGHAVIDPPPPGLINQRIEALPIPAHTRRQLEQSTRLINTRSIIDGTWRA